MMARKPLPLAEQTEIPIQPVAKPILCSPFAEPGQHWVYDTHTGEARQGTRTGPGQASSSAALGQCGQLLAVNCWGQLGPWAFHACQDSQRAIDEIRDLRR